MRDIIVRSRFWLSSPVDFNDPFDMAAKIVAEASIKETQKRIEGLLKLKGLNWSQRQKERPRLVAQGLADIAQRAQTAHRENIKNTGVYSFGGDPRSILMWSHYASNHEGFCLQFEFAKDPKTFFQSINVKYSEDYPVVNWVTQFKEGIEAIIERKHIGWSYELERRIIVPEAAHQYLPFRAEALRGIIIGCRASEQSLKKLDELLEERSSHGLQAKALSCSSAR